MTPDIGTVESIAASGKGWSTGKAINIKKLFYNTLRDAQDIIQISTYSLGRDNEEVNEFFKIIEERLPDLTFVNIIVNDDGKVDGTCSEYAKQKMSRLKEKFEDKFLPQYFDSSKTDRILHAKIVAVDRKLVLVGSANISQSALVSNYEIMLKIGSMEKPATAAGTISLMLEDLSKMIQRETDET